MSSVYHGWLRAVVTHSLCLAMWLNCCPPVFSLPQDDEQAAIRRLAENYFAVYQ